MPRVPEYSRYIRTGVNRMNDLIRDLLEYSRITRDEVAPVQPVSFQEVVGEVLWNLQAQISETGAMIRAEALPTVRGGPELRWSTCCRTWWATPSSTPGIGGRKFT